jgi:hypothetical protein
MSLIAIDMKTMATGPGTDVIKVFMAVIYEWAKEGHHDTQHNCVQRK